jgi:hypothetical protein
MITLEVGQEVIERAGNNEEGFGARILGKYDLRQIVDRGEILKVLDRRQGIGVSGKDRFDRRKGTRYLGLYRVRGGDAIKVVRVIHRNGGALPIERALPIEGDLTSDESTMIPEDRQRVREFIDRNANGIYEVGGLFGDCRDIRTVMPFMLGMFALARREGWQAAVQTQNPSHCRFYGKIGTIGRFLRLNDMNVYQPLTGLYDDRMGRPAKALGIEKSDFDRFWERGRLDRFAEYL